VEYINAIRMRYRIMQQADPILEQYDIIITSPETGDQLAVTNLTGHPSVTLPVGFNKAGMPVAISFIGKLYQEADLLAFVHWYQQHTAFHLKHPAAFTE